MPVDPRARVAAEQEALLAALLHGEEPPEGFDRARVAAASEALAHKKRRVTEQRARTTRRPGRSRPSLWRRLLGRLFGVGATSG